MSRFDGRVAWITGGGSGLGAGLAKALAREGARVAISGRRVDRLDALVQEMGADRALALPGDVRDEAWQEQAADRVAKHFGHLDLAIANAGFSVGGRIGDLRAEDWRRQFETNVVALATTSRVAMPHLAARRGQLVLIGSVAGFVSFPGHGPYQASKAAVRAIGETLWLEGRALGVDVTTIHPGFVESEIGQVDRDGTFHPERADRRPAQLMWTTKDAVTAMLRGIAARRRELVFTGHGKLGVFVARHASGLLAHLLARIRVER